MSIQKETRRTRSLPFGDFPFDHLFGIRSVPMDPSGGIRRLPRYPKVIMDLRSRLSYRECARRTSRSGYRPIAPRSRWPRALPTGIPESVRRISTGVPLSHTAQSGKCLRKTGAWNTEIDL